MSAPHKSECPAATGHFADQSNLSAPIVRDDDALRKLTATLKAELALKGHAVYDLSDGAFLVTRWGLSRRCADLSELRRFAQQIGAC